MIRRDVLDAGYIALRNISGPVRRPDQPFDADDIDPANSARFSFDAADRKTRTREADLRLAEYLLSHKHTTPFEMIELWFEMKMPLFVARHFVRHRTASINEISGRYITFPKEFYIPRHEDVGVKAATNKQGRVPGVANPYAPEFCEALKQTCENAYAQYRKDLDNGVAEEIARIQLPVNLYTKWLWQQDLHNLLHFIAVRIDNHAQFESRQYAHAIYEILKEVLPHTMKLFDKYCRMPEHTEIPVTQKAQASQQRV